MAPLTALSLLMKPILPVTLLLLAVGAPLAQLVATPPLVPAPLPLTALQLLLSLLLFLFVQLLLFELAAAPVSDGHAVSVAAVAGDFRRRVRWFWRTERRDVAGVVGLAAETAVVAFVRRLLPRNVVDETGVKLVDELKQAEKMRKSSKICDSRR